jgi:midasin
MLKISSRSLWEGVSFMGDLVASLHSVADSLFKQVIVNLSLFCVVAPS